MNWQRIIFGAICVSFLVTSPKVWSRSDSNESNACFIVLKSPSVLMYQHTLSGKSPRSSALFKTKSTQTHQYAQTLATEQDRVEQQILSVGSEIQVLHRYNQLVNAFTVLANPEDWEKFRQIDGVAYVSPIRRMKPVLTNSASLLNLPGIWDQAGGGANAGNGVFIAIIDTGIDITHPAFDPEGFSYPDGFPKGDSSFTTEKVIVARVFPPLTGSKGDTTLYDLIGHGSNVSSIAAGNWQTSSPLGVLQGSAPRAWLGNYKVFTSDYTDNDQVVRAVESAVEDGADVINLSLGSEVFGDPNHDVQLLALQNAIDLGVVVVIAAANGGEALTIGSPAQLQDAITVGSVTNSHLSSGNPDADTVMLTVIADGQVVGDQITGRVGGASLPLTKAIIGTFPIQDIDQLDGGGYGTSSDGLACDAVVLDRMINGWALVNRGTCTFEQKMKNILSLGVTGVIFDDVKNAGGYPDCGSNSIPGMMIDADKGQLIRDAIASSQNVEIRIDGPAITDSKQDANRLSTFSGIGPSVNYTLKPDLVTVGEGSFAATQNDDTTQLDSFNASGFIWMSGTSMSSPRVAGVAAVLRQLHPDWPPLWIKSALSLSAHTPVQRKSGTEATILERGAGIMDADAAARVDTIVLPSLLNFGVHMVPEIPAQSQWITVVNVTSDPCTYELRLADESASLGITVSEGLFTLAPEEKRDIEISLPSLSDLPFGDTEGQLQLTNQTTSKSYSIPFWVQVQSVQSPWGDVLIVDDDHAQSYETYYMERLDEIGVQYSWWDVNAMSGFPVADYISHFKTVLWFMADNTLSSITDQNSTDYALQYNARHLFESSLMQYLVDGGSLFLSGEDFSDDQETIAFTQEVLMVSPQDQKNGAKTVQGYANNPVADGLGPFTLTFPQGLDNFPDILTLLDTTQAEKAFYYNDNTAKTIGVTIDACSYRVVYLAFPVETMEAVAGETLLKKSLDWLQTKDISGAARITEIDPNQIDVSQDGGPYSLTIQGLDFAFKNGYRAYLGSVPIDSLTRENCNTLTGTLPAGIEPGTYTLRLVTGDGHEFRQENALTVLDSTGTRVSDWTHY